MVSTLVVEWIEIEKLVLIHTSRGVSTLVVEWIEMPSGATYKAHSSVSTLVVEWIEIVSQYFPAVRHYRLHPRGGVD